MKPVPTLSILIPSIYERTQSHLIPLINKIGNPDFIEVLTFSDNKYRSIGAKRQALLNISEGIYIMYLDDDDDIEQVAIDEILKGCITGVDVITWKQRVILNDDPERILTFKFGHPVNEEPANEFTRPPWHVCAWRSEVVKNCTFLNSMYGEDWHFAEQANKNAQTSFHIDKILTTYRFNSNLTQAFTNE